MIEPTIDKSQKNQGFYQFLKESVECFGITDFDTIRNASKEGWKLYNNFQTMMRNGIEYKTALKNALKGKIVLDSDDTDYPISIALVAHFANLLSFFLIFVLLVLNFYNQHNQYIYLNKKAKQQEQHKYWEL